MSYVVELLKAIDHDHEAFASRIMQDAAVWNLTYGVGITSAIIVAVDRECKVQRARLKTGIQRAPPPQNHILYVMAH